MLLSNLVRQANYNGRRKHASEAIEQYDVTPIDSKAKLQLCVREQYIYYHNVLQAGVNLF